MKRFYTFDTGSLWRNYPFQMPPYHYAKYLRNINFKHAIVDCGVEIFFHGAKEYPPWFFNRYEFLCQQLTEIYGDRVWCVIPDYPDDYRNNPIAHNVHRTLRNIQRFHKVKGVNWVYPLQCDYLNLQSFHDSCHQVMGFNPERVAIGTVCKTRNVEFIEKCCRMARRHFYTQHIHAFGPTLNALPKILPHIDSWDSTAYFYSSEGSLCKKKKERFAYFQAYLEKIDSILSDFHSQKTLTEDLNKIT